MASPIIALLVVVAAINIASALVWLRLLYLVRTADPILSLRTATVYTRYLFGQIMSGKFWKPSSVVLGQPERDPVIRKVKGSSQFETIATVASFVKDLPLNVVPYLV